MSPSKPMIERARRGPYDELSTPDEAVDYLYPYLPEFITVWEPCVGEGNIRRYFEADVMAQVKITTGDFLLKAWPHPATHLITNPPFSKKAEFLARCEELGRPWALLLPVTTLGVRKCQQHLEDAEIIFLPRRIDFTGKKRPWFAVAWFTKGLRIGKQLNFP